MIKSIIEQAPSTLVQNKPGSGINQICIGYLPLPGLQQRYAYMSREGRRTIYLIFPAAKTV